MSNPQLLEFQEDKEVNYDYIDNNEPSIGKYLSEIRKSEQIKEINTGAKQIRDEIAKEVKIAKEKEKAIRKAASDNDQPFSEKEQYGNTANEIKKLIDKFKAGNSERLIKGLFAGETQFTYMTESQNNIYSTSKLFQFWTFCRMFNSNDPNKLPDPTVVNRDYTISPGIFSKTKLSDIKVSFTPFSNKLVFRKVVRIENEDIYISPFIDDLSKFNPQLVYKMSFEGKKYEVLVEKSLNKVIIYNTDKPILSDAINQAINQGNFVALSQKYGGIVVLNNGTSSTNDDSIIEFNEYKKMSLKDLRKEDTIQEILDGGELVFKFKSSQSFITDVYFLNAEAISKNIGFFCTYKLLDVLNANTSLLSANPKKAVEFFKNRIANYKYIILTTTNKTVEERETLWETYNEIKSGLKLFEDVEKVLIDMIFKVDKYALFRLNSVTTIKKILNLLIRLVKACKLANEFLAELDNNIKIKIETFLLDKLFESYVKYNTIRTLFKLLPGFLERSMFLVNGLSADNVYVKSTLDGVVPDPADGLVEAFKWIYDKATTLYDIIRPTLADKSTRIVKDYLLKIAKEKEKEISKFAKMVYANDKVFGKNLDNFLAGQLSSLSNNINALQADLLNIEGSEVNDYLKSVIKTLNDKKQKLLDTQNEINNASNKREKLLILKANIPELRLDFVNALRHTDVDQIIQGDIEMMDIDNILDDIEMADKDNTLDDSFMDDAEIILKSGDINLGDFRKLANEKKIDLLKAKISKKKSQPKKEKENVEISLFSKRKRNRREEKQDKSDKKSGIKASSSRSLR